MAVTDTLRELREQVEQNLSEMKDTAALDALRVKVLGKKGTLTELLKGMGKLAPEDIPAILDSGNRTLAGPTVPPGGLYMTRLWYDEDVV